MSMIWLTRLRKRKVGPPKIVIKKLYVLCQKRERIGNKTVLILMIWLTRVGKRKVGPPKITIKKLYVLCQKERKKRNQDGPDVDDLVDPPKKKKSRTAEDSNKEIILSMPKQEIAKKSTLNVSHLGEALKQQSPKNENEPNTKAKEIGKAKKNKSLSLRGQNVGTIELFQVSLYKRAAVLCTRTRSKYHRFLLQNNLS